MNNRYTLKLDYPSFCDALALANEHGTRIRLHDQERLLSFLDSVHLDPGALLMLPLELGLPEPKTAVIESGLLRGVYAYSLVTQEVYTVIEAEREPTALRRYREMDLDVVLSYSTEDRALALEIAKGLEANGVATYVIDVNADPHDPAWRWRFREALFHAHFAVPILSRAYLRRAGSADELREASWITVEHRSTEFFYPLVPLVEPGAEGTPPSHVAAHARGADDDAYVWTHVFGLPWDLPVDELARFFRSLARNARNERDGAFLDTLAPYLRAVRFGAIERGPVAELYLSRSPAGGSDETFHVFLIGPSGMTRYLGLHATSPGAESVTDGQEGLARVVAHVGDGGSDRNRR